MAGKDKKEEKTKTKQSKAHFDALFLSLCVSSSHFFLPVFPLSVSVGVCVLQSVRVCSSD